VGETIVIHLNRSDEQVADLKAHGRCVFELDDVLAMIPSYWIDPQNAAVATAYHRAVIFECEAVVSDDPSVLAEQQAMLLARYQPEGGFRAVEPHDPLYQKAIAMIAAVQLKIKHRRVKFKLGQNRSAEVRSKVIDELRRRGRPNDARAAEAVQRTLGLKTQG
jgi:predicted FMN-binding regulatory protein PaiB